METDSTQSAFKTQDGRTKAEYLDGFRRHVPGRLKDVEFTVSKALVGMSAMYALASMLNDISGDNEEHTDRKDQQSWFSACAWVASSTSPTPVTNARKL